MASPHGLTFTANGFSPSNWETWEEVPCDAKDTVQDAVQADSWSWTEPLIQALQRVQKLQGTGRTELSFEALKLQSLEPFLEVQALPRQLTKLSLRDNPWQDPALLLSQLQPLHQLISLDLSKCRLDSLTHLPRLQLRHLRLEENQLRSTLGIAGCPRLLEVSLARNRLTSTEQLETLLELRVLDLAENCLTSSQRCLRPLAACTQLSELHLQGNPLAKDGNPLRSLFPSLETLDSRPLRRSRGGVATPVVPTAVPAPRGPWRDDGAVATEYLGKTKCYARPTRSSAIKACRAAPPDAEPPPPPLCPRARAPPRPRSFAPPPRPLEPVETGPRTSPKKEPFVASLVPQRGTTRIGHDQGTVDQLMRCRDLIEEKRRLLQKITSKLGEGVAKTSFSAP